MMRATEAAPHTSPQVGESLSAPNTSRKAAVSTPEQKQQRDAQITLLSDLAGELLAASRNLSSPAKAAGYLEAVKLINARRDALMHGRKPVAVESAPDAEAPLIKPVAKTQGEKFWGVRL